MFYKKWAKENNDELHAQEIAGKDLEIQRLKQINETVRAENHRINHRLASLERNILILSEKVQNYLPAEISEELSTSLKDIQRLSEEYHSKIDKVKKSKSLPSTNIQMIDSLFNLYLARFADNKIDFNLKVNGSIIHMMETTVSQSQLETLIGDHLQDALIAINSSDNDTRNVLAVIGAVDGCYEFKVYDSGISFEIDTLIKLGTERITTHADSGGSGIGFMTTFETMKECGASLIIDEKEHGGNFTKSVCIRFDGKNKYVIQTYRADEFPESDRYILNGNVVATHVMS